MTRADKFSDHLECVTYDRLLEINDLKKFIDLPLQHNPHLSKDQLAHYINNANHELTELAEKINKEQSIYHVSCWYISQNENENELMWRSYGFDKEANTNGFLIRISLNDFISHLNTIESLNPELPQVVYGSVSYYDFNKKASIQRIKYNGFRKHISFKDESEFRLVYKNQNVQTVENIFLKLPRSFYDDLRITVHPDYNFNDFEKIRDKIEQEFDQTLNLSELHIWYKLKEKLKNKACSTDSTLF